jgi:DNA modification methylase
MSTPYYQDDSVTLYHGLAGDVLASLADRSVDCVITDPPFDAKTHREARSNSTKNGVSGKGSRAISGGSTVKFASLTHVEQISQFAEMGRLTRGWVVSNVATDTAFRFEVEGPPPGLRLLRVGVWVKTNPMPGMSGDRPAMGWEAIAYLHREDTKPAWNGGGRAANYVLATSQGSGHPTQKPLVMVSDWVRLFSNPGDLILDPYAGSGTTLRAAKNEGRRAIGVEMDERYCEMAALRLSQDVFDFGETA